MPPFSTLSDDVLLVVLRFLSPHPRMFRYPAIRRYRDVIALHVTCAAWRDACRAYFAAWCDDLSRSFRWARCAGHPNRSTCPRFRFSISRMSLSTPRAYTAGCVWCRQWRCAAHTVHSDHHVDPVTHMCNACQRVTHALLTAAIHSAFDHVRMHTACEHEVIEHLQSILLINTEQPLVALGSDAGSAHVHSSYTFNIEEHDLHDVAIALNDAFALGEWYSGITMYCEAHPIHFSNLFTITAHTGVAAGDESAAAVTRRALATLAAQGSRAPSPEDTREPDDAGPPRRLARRAATSAPRGD